MEQKKSFFETTSFWNLERTLQDIRETEYWLSDYIKHFFADAAHQKMTEMDARRGICAMLALQEFRQKQVSLLWTPPEKSILPDAQDALSIEFTFKNLKRLSAAVSIWQSLLRVFEKEELPFKGDEVQFLKSSIDPWEKFRKSVNTRRDFLEKQKAESFTKIFLTVQEIFQHDSEALQKIARGLDFAALSTFFSFNEDYVPIHQQMEALLRAYVLAALASAIHVPYLEPLEDTSNFWRSVALVLSRYPYIHQLISATFPEKSAELFAEPTPENRRRMAETLQSQEVLRQVLSAF